ncbi:MAG: flavodoxin family protein [Thermoplasmata archaeon]
MVIIVKVCGIIGSPNKKGNVDMLVNRVLEGADSQGAEIDRIYLNDLSIKPCQDCAEDPDPRYCLYDDDMDMIYNALGTCDVIVLGSPVYFDTVSAQTKLMIDRCNCLTPYVKQSDGTYAFERRMKKRKKGVFIATEGTDRDFGPILKTVKGFFRWANIELVDTILYHSNENELGSVEKDEETMAQALDIGARVVSQD